MFERRASIQIVLVATLCGLAACKDEPASGGDFLQPNSGAPDELWEVGEAPTGSNSAERVPATKDEPELPPGERAFVVELDEHAAFGGEVQKGDRVDFTAVLDVVSKDQVIAEAGGGRQEGLVGITLLQNVYVLGVEPPAGDEKPWGLSVAVTRDEAQMLRLAEARGDLFTTLRSWDDKEISTVRKVALTEVLLGLEAINRARMERQRSGAKQGSRPAPTSGPLAGQVQENMLAMALPVDPSTVSRRHLGPGARIDVMGTFEITDRDRLTSPQDKPQAEKSYVTMSLLHNVRVLAPPNEDRENPPIFVEVTRKEAKVLALSASRGELDVMVRGDGDTDIDTIKRTTSTQLLEDLEVINRSRKTRHRVRRRPRKKKDTGIQIIRGDSSGGAPGVPSPPKTKPEKKQAQQASARSASKPIVVQDRDANSNKDEPKASDKPHPGSIFSAKETPRSTFGLDVDTSSYTLVRRYLRDGELPPDESVRVEEFVNYFDYDNPYPETQPFAVTVEGAPSPFRRSKRHRLVRIGVQARKADGRKRRPVNLTFLVDTSSSMRGGEKLGLAKKALVRLAGNLGPDDTISVVQYDDRVEQVLARTSATHKPTIAEAVRSMKTGGATDMEAGMKFAYRLAASGFEEDKENRVVIVSDGDPNIGSETYEGLLRSVARGRERGVTLSTLGVGSGNYRDVLMEQLADNGDGNSYYIDSDEEIKRLFCERLLSTLVVVARDVKAQVEFDAQVVESYRRIGYENRAMTQEQWQDTEADAGELGAGHRVTVLYEVRLVENAPDRALGTVKVRYKDAKGDKPREIGVSLARESMRTSFGEASDDLRFAASIVGFAEILRETPLSHYLSLEAIAKNAKEAAGEDPDRLEFVELIEQARKVREIRGASSPDKPRVKRSP